MKIELKNQYVAILKEESGEVVGVFHSTTYANNSMRNAVALHYDLPMVDMITDRDFVQPWDYEQPYEFVLYRSTGHDEDEYVTLTMTFAPIY